MEKYFHLVLQAKGGIGKSLTASILAQYYSKRGCNVTAIDCDPSTPTFSAIPGLSAVPLQILEDDEINPRRFDEMMEIIFSAEDDAQIVCDIGTSAFVQFSSYLTQNAALPFLQDNGVQVLIHSPICGGPAFKSTIDGLGALFDLFRTTRFVVWENEFFGAIAKDGKGFKESKLYEAYKDQILEVLVHPKVQQSTFGADVHSMMERNSTFEAAIKSADFKIMSRQRLRQIWTAHVEQLDMSQISAPQPNEEAAE